MNLKPIFRFAPSPNGFLHLGHAYSALLNFHYAKKINADFLLRIEDIDLARSKKVFIDAIYQDLTWLGLSWQKPILMQSSNFNSYKKAANHLIEMDLLYPCFCTRKEIAKNAIKKDPDGAPLYNEHCKILSKGDVVKKISDSLPHQWRLNMDEAIKQTGNLTYLSAQPNPTSKLIEHQIRPQDWGDVVILRKDYPTSYHLSVVIDDAAQNISHIVRGKDLQHSTDVHRILQKLLGLNSPIYTHHDLILDDDNLKLAKSKNSMAIRDLREQGLSAKEIKEKFGFNL